MTDFFLTINIYRDQKHDNKKEPKYQVKELDDNNQKNNNQEKEDHYNNLDVY